MGTTTLLDLLQRVIERTYRMDTGVADLARFVIGDRGYARLTRRRRVVAAVGHSFARAAVLVSEAGDGTLRANIYYPDELIAALEARNPLRGLDGQNLDPFAVFVEELDHFLTLADRARRGRRQSLLDLELHANVTKYVAARHFLARSCGRPLDGGERQWLRWSLFEKAVPAPAAAAVAERYRHADRLGWRYSRHLDRLRPADQLRELRRFHHLPPSAGRRRMELVD